MKNILGIINLVLILALGVYVIMSNQTGEKKAYVLNQRVFDEFKGKKALEEKLTALRAANKATLDSLTKVVQANPRNLQLVLHYDKTARTMELEDQQLSAQYTADIWKRINKHMAEYGKEKGYSFIFGATGEGNLMYASEGNNVTDEVIILHQLKNTKESRAKFNLSETHPQVLGFKNV